MNLHREALEYMNNQATSDVKRKGQAEGSMFVVGKGGSLGGLTHKPQTPC